MPGLLGDGLQGTSPPFSASRVALVATAMTLVHFDATRPDAGTSTAPAGAACIASGVSARPSSPPAPRRTISFSRSMTSKDRSARTCTTIMWIGFWCTDVDGSYPHMSSIMSVCASIADMPVATRLLSSTQNPPRPLSLPRVLLASIAAMCAPSRIALRVASRRSARDRAGRCSSTPTPRAS